MKKEIYLDERNKRINELINPSKKDKVLIIGTGVSPKTEFFLSKLYNCYNIVSGDIDRKNIENGKKFLPEVDFIYLDAQKTFPFKKETFDKIVMTEVLEHLKREKFVLKEIQRILKRDGKLILSVPKRRWFNVLSPITHVQHFREYDEKKIKSVLGQNNFKVEEIFVGGDIFDLLNLWAHLIYKYFFRILHVDPFFKKNLEKSFSKSFRGKGTDILVRARKNNLNAKNKIL
ncbi:MAG: class I SAM-dependent methyltransferase [archaeon]|nr:class I SAM-dependent methyltransferase [archaeon]